MQVSSKGRYALRVMADIARHDKDFVPISDIAARQSITVKYLEKIMSMLSKAKLVTSFRGANGGYKLSKSAKEYSVLEILEAVGEGTKLTVCTSNGECSMEHVCDTMRVWHNLSNLINDYLSKVTLEDLIKNN